MGVVVVVYKATKAMAVILRRIFSPWNFSIYGTEISVSMSLSKLSQTLTQKFNGLEWMGNLGSQDRCFEKWRCLVLYAFWEIFQYVIDNLTPFWKVAQKSSRNSQSRSVVTIMHSLFLRSIFLIAWFWCSSSSPLASLKFSKLAVGWKVFAKIN